MGGGWARGRRRGRGSRWWFSRLIGICIGAMRGVVVTGRETVLVRWAGWGCGASSGVRGGIIWLLRGMMGGLRYWALRLCVVSLVLT